MIDSQGYLRCDSCHTILGRIVDDRVEIVCYRSKCHRHHALKLPIQKHHIATASGRVQNFIGEVKIS